MPTPCEKAPDPELGHDPLDKERYLSTEWAAREWRQVFERCWLYALPAADVAAPGTFATFDIGPESVVLTRTADGELRAFYNVCQHRGRRLVDAPCGRANAFRCPYHAWTYRLDGSVRTILDREVFPDNLDQDSLTIPPVRVGTWGGLVWICLDPDTPPLLDYLGVVPDHLACYPLDRYAIVDDQSVRWDCNWKVAMDAFHESYHTLGTHPQMMEYVADTNVQIDCYGMHSRFLMPWGAPAPRVRNRSRPNATQAVLFAPYGFDVAAFDGTADEAYLEFQRRKRDWMLERGYDLHDLDVGQFTDVVSYTIFPNIQIALSADRFLLTRHRPDPHDPTKMVFDAQSFAHVLPGQEWPARPTTRTGAGLDFDYAPDFVAQDAVNAPAIQRGLASKGFRGAVLGDLELRIRHFHSVLDEHMSRA